MSNVIKFYPNDAFDNPDLVLEQAIGIYEDVLVFGIDKGGNMDCRASNMTDEHLLWLVSKFQHKLMNGDYAEEDD